MRHGLSAWHAVGRIWRADAALSLFARNYNSCLPDWRLTTEYPEPAVSHHHPVSGGSNSNCAPLLVLGAPIVCAWSWNSAPFPHITHRIGVVVHPIFHRQLELWHAMAGARAHCAHPALQCCICSHGLPAVVGQSSGTQRRQRIGVQWRSVLLASLGRISILRGVTIGDPFGLHYSRVSRIICKAKGKT